MVAVSVDPPETNAALVASERFPYPILSDPKRELLARLGAVHAGEGPGGSDVAVPTTYVVARDGTVAWMRRASTVRHRPDPDDVLAAVRSVK